RRRGREQLLPARGGTVKDSDAQVIKVRPERDLPRPHGRGDELGRDDKSVPALAITDEFGNRRERGSPLAGAEGGDQEGGIVFVKEGRRAVLIGVQGARHFAPLVILLLV